MQEQKQTCCALNSNDEIPGLVVFLARHLPVGQGLLMHEVF